MNFIDIIAIIALGFGAYRGFRNGIILELAGLLGLIVGIWAGLRLAFIFADYYKENFDIPDNYIPLIAFLTAFLIGIGAVWLAGRLLNKFVNSVALGLPNRIGGAVFGAAKWAFIAGTVLSLIGNSEVISKETRESSTAYPMLGAYCKAVQGYTIGLIPAASNVFKDVEEYFVEMDSTRARQGQPTPEDVEDPDNENTPEESEESGPTSSIQSDPATLVRMSQL